MHRDLERGLHKLLFIFAIAIALTTGGRVVCAQRPDEGGVSFDGGGQEVLESIFYGTCALQPDSRSGVVAAYEQRRNLYDR
jgi:hypothetical protein